MNALMTLLAQAVVGSTPQFDTTIHLSDVILFLGGLVAFLKMFISQRDILRDLVKAIGQTYPPAGILGTLGEHDTELAAHREWLVREGLDQRRGAGRRDYDDSKPHDAERGRHRT